MLYLKKLRTAHLLLIFSAILFPITGKAQVVDFDHYRVLEPQSPLPVELTEGLREQIERDYHKLKSKHKSDKKGVKDKKQFLLFSKFGMIQLMRSGHVLFNDPLSKYLNEVMAKIIADNGKKDKVKVFVIRSSIVNAFAFDDGLVFVTMGMLARLNSEAELAYLLCHEFIHYSKKHAMDSYVEGKKIETARSRTLSTEDRTILKSRYSKEIEKEADIKGLKLFLNTRYNLDAPMSLFEHLKFDYLPLRDEPFHQSFFESGSLRLPKSYVLNNVNAIEADEVEEADDERSSHPNIRKRKAEIRVQIGDEPNEGREDFLISAERFDLNKKIAQFEVCRLDLLDHEYARAFYNAYALLKENPNSNYLHAVMCKALYGLATYSNHRRMKTVFQGATEVQGESQRFYHLLATLTREELELLALNFSWKCRLKFPGNSEIVNISEELTKQAVEFFSINRYTFKTEPMDSIALRYVEALDTAVVRDKHFEIRKIRQN
jgi:beta-barrel assembly-enhancing protease